MSNGRQKRQLTKFLNAALKIAWRRTRNKERQSGRKSSKIAAREKKLRRKKKKEKLEKVRKGKSESLQLLASEMESIDFGELKFIKLLVVSDKLERDRASKKFERWARTLTAPMPMLDARKLWKGLFYGKT